MFIGRKKKHSQIRVFWALQGILALFLGLFVVIGPTETAKAVIYTPLSNQRAKDYAIIRKDSTWHVFAIWCDLTLGCDAQRRGLMHLTSTDLKNWTEVGFILPPDGGTDFDDYDIWAPSIVERDGTYYMYYTGVYKNGSNTLVQKVGLATSTDLTSWTKYSTTPVFDCTGLSGVYNNPANNADGAACRDPYVFWDEGEHQWVMSISSRRTGSVPANNMSIALATSEDLLTWRPYGFINATDDYTAESSHIFKHGSTYYMVYTEDGSGSDWIDYLTSTDLYTGWTRIGDLSPVNQYEYGSEYIADRGHEYFTRIDANNVGIDFDEITWTGTPFSFTDPAYGSIGDTVWDDVDADGVQDGGESGIDGVTLTVYLDDGDGIFNPTSDGVYRTATTGDDPNTGGTQHGYYKISDVLPDSYWVSINPTNYETGNALAGRVATTNATVSSVTVSASQNTTTLDHGFVTLATTWPLATAGNFAVGSGASLANGRATTAEAGGVAWWSKKYTYRKQLTVTANTQTLTTSKTIVLNENLAALVTAGKLQSSYADARLVYWDGSSNHTIDLDIIDSTTLRFKVQSTITAGSSDGGYYLYYGSPQAVAKPAHLANVYEYYASFNSPDATTYGTWTENGGSNWQISANKWRQLTTSAGDMFSRDTGTAIDLSQDWAQETTMTIANTGTSKVGGLTFHSPFAYGNEAYWLSYYAGASQKMGLYHWAWSQTSFTAPNATGLTIPTNTPIVSRFEYAYGTSAFRVIRGYQNNTLRISSNENMVGGDSGYDIWYQDVCPCTNKQAYFALNTYEGDVSFNDVKGWQLHDGSVSAGSETPLYPTVTATVNPIAGQAIDFGRLTSFAASSLDQGGAVKFVLSNDAGTTWQYWNGSAWTVSNSSIAQANTTAEINANAGSFPIGSGSFLWRAVFSASSNTYPVVLQAGATVNHVSATPTIASTSPADGATITTTRPTMHFVATDTDADALQYEVQFDTTPSFNGNNLVTYAQASSQTGWSGQDALAATAYASGTTATFTVPDALVGRQYYWRVRAIDPQGSVHYSSYTSARSLVGPTTLTVTTPSIVGRSANEIIISWTSNLPASSRVEYGSTSSYGSVAESSTLTTEHTITIANLTPSTTYHFRVLSTDASSQTAASLDQTVLTYRETSLPPPVIVLPQKEMIAYESRPLITGLALAGKTIFLFVDDALLATVRATNDPSGTGHFFFRMTRPLGPGRHTLQALARDDETRALSPYTDKRIFFTFPGSAPTILYPLEGLSTTRERVTVRGLSWRQHTVRIYLDGRFAASVVPTERSLPTSVFTYVTPRLSAGMHTLYVRHVAPDGTFGRRGATRTFSVAAPDELYTVQLGDTVWSIAQRYLGDGARYPEILAANQDRYPHLQSQLRLTVGQRLRIFQ